MLYIFGVHSVVMWGRLTAEDQWASIAGVLFSDGDWRWNFIGLCSEKLLILWLKYELLVILLAKACYRRALAVRYQYVDWNLIIFVRSTLWYRCWVIAGSFCVGFALSLSDIAIVCVGFPFICWLWIHILHPKLSKYSQMRKPRMREDTDVKGIYLQMHTLNISDRVQTFTTQSTWIG